MRRAIPLLFVSAVLASCAPTAPDRWQGYASVDSYVASGEVRLFWSTTTDPGCIDFPCPPPGPKIARVLLEQSTSGPSAGWRIVLVRTTSGSDSAAIGKLEDGKLYWFRVVALDVAGRQLLASTPIMTMPGPPSVPSLSVPVEVVGRFSWSPGGDSIAFVDGSVLGERSLAVIDIRSLAVAHLETYSGDEWITDAIWRSDGASIAYTHTPTLMAGGIDYRVWTLDFPPGAVGIQTSGRVDFDPCWGGSGWMYFCRGTFDPPNIPEIWRVRVGEASSMQAVTADPSIYKYSPSVRPSDDWIVYQGRPRKAYAAPQLFTVHPGGSSVPLTNADGYVDSRPFWSPDGQHVVFVSTRSGHSEVWSADVRTRALRQLTRGPRGANRLTACWSPNGTRLAVLDEREEGWSERGRLEIYENIAPLP